MSEHECGVTAPTNGPEPNPAVTPGEPAQSQGYGQQQTGGQGQTQTGNQGQGQPQGWTPPPPYQGQTPWYPPPPWAADPRQAYYPPYPGAPYAPTPGAHPGLPGWMPPPPQGYAHQGQSPRVSDLVDEIANGGNGLSSIGRLLNVDDVDFWKGALVGAAAVLLLTNESVQGALFGNRANGKAGNGSGDAT